jgi:hypothetical protein
VPVFITRTEANELAVKIVTERADPDFGWVPDEDKSLWLKEPAARSLQDVLASHLAVAPLERGEYVVIPVTGGAPDLRAHNPTSVAEALMRVLAEPDLLEHIAAGDLSARLVEAIHGAIRLSEMRTAVSDLRELLESGEAREEVYQQWCEEHSWAFGNAYVIRDDIHTISSGDRLDLLLPRVFSGYRDIVELKRPDVTVVGWDSARKHYYFTAEVSKAIGQCHRYLDVLHEEAMHGLRDHPEIIAYHPRATIVIGRSHDWKPLRVRALHGLNSRMVGITVMTYDQLLAQGERLLDMLDEPDR